MAGSIPNVPTNFVALVGNGSVYLSWQAVSGSTAYNILRSSDSVNYSKIAATSSISYTDTSASTGKLYYYEVQSANANGTSNPTAAISVTPVNFGQVSLGQVRLAAQQRSDMVNNNFVTTQEWNYYINNSYFELRDILVQVYGDEYYVAQPYQFITDNRYPALYPLPTDFYKLLGADLAIGSGNTAWLTLKKFAFISRNRYIYGNTPISFLGVLQLRYRIVGSNFELVPQPAPNQTVQLWYVPRPTVLLADSDILDGIAGWDEYVVVDAAIKAMQKEESDVTVLMAQKQMLRQRIEAAASNRDQGEAECASDVRRLDGNCFGDGYGGNSPMGGW